MFMTARSSTRVIDPDNADPDVWADSAYRGEDTEAVLEEAEYARHIHEKGQKDRPLTEAQKQRNRERCRVEHVFGFQQTSLGGKLIRSIGLARAQVEIGLMNLTDNLMRYLQLSRQGTRVPAAAS